MTNSFEIIFDQAVIKKFSEKLTLVLFDVRGQEFESWPEPKEDAGEQARKVAASWEPASVFELSFEIWHQNICPQKSNAPAVSSFLDFN